MAKSKGNKRQNQKSKEQLIAENEQLRRWRLSEKWVRLSQVFAKYIAYCVMTYLICDAVKFLAGKTTFAHIIVGVFGDLPIADKVIWLVAGFCFLWACAERRLRKRKTKYLADRVKHLEKRFDPRRTSSNLTPYGDTNPTD